MEHLSIRFAADAAPLVEDRVTVQCYSSCARGLPAAAEEWDLSQLLLEDQPVQRGTVVAYLNAISQHLNNEPMLDEEPDAGSPARNMAGLAQLLAFADAVGTSRGLLLALDAQVSAAALLVAEVQMGQQQLQLAADSCCCFNRTSPLDLWRFDSGASKALNIVAASSAADKERCRQHFVQQVEALLYLAYKLQLPQLQQVMHRCMFGNSCLQCGLLDADAMRAVGSARVLDAAGGCGVARGAFFSVGPPRWLHLQVAVKAGGRC